MPLFTVIMLDCLRKYWSPGILGLVMPMSAQEWGKSNLTLGCLWGFSIWSDRFGRFWAPLTSFHVGHIIQSLSSFTSINYWLERLLKWKTLLRVCMPGDLLPIISVVSSVWIFHKPGFKHITYFSPSLPITCSLRQWVAVIFLEHHAVILSC